MIFSRINHNQLSRIIVRYGSSNANGTQSEEIAKIISRTQVIVNEKDCSQIVEKIIAEESPIGVDAEG